MHQNNTMQQLSNASRIWFSYARVSTKMQDTGKASIPFQHEYNSNELQTTLGIDKNDVIKINETVPIYKTYTEQFELVSLLEQHMAGIAIYDVSRLCRTLKNAISIIDKYIIPNDIAIYVTSTKQYYDKKITNLDKLKADVIQVETDLHLQIERRTKTINFKKYLGHIVGMAPYGYQKINDIKHGVIIKKLEKNENEQQILQLIYDLQNSKNEYKILMGLEKLKINILDETNVKLIELFMNQKQFEGLGNNELVLVNAKCIYKKIAILLNLLGITKRNNMWSKMSVKKALAKFKPLNSDELDKIMDTVSLTDNKRIATVSAMDLEKESNDDGELIMKKVKYD